MKLQQAQIINYEKHHAMPAVIVTMPKGSILLKVKALMDGIYGWWAVPEVVMSISKDITAPLANDSIEMQQEKYVILKTGNSIPNDGTLIDILDMVIEDDKGDQRIIIYPLYRIK